MYFYIKYIWLHGYVEILTEKILWLKVKLLRSLDMIILIKNIFSFALKLWYDGFEVTY